jgi:hypothetical protein
MATEGEEYQELCDFLEDSFSSPQLEIFLKRNGYKEVAAAVNRDDGATEYVFHVVEELDRRGLINLEFFHRLAKARPRKAARIERLRESWPLEDEARPGSADPTGAIPEPPGEPPQVVDTPSLLRSLAQLDPSDMAALVAAVEGASARVTRQAPVRQQASELVTWVLSATGPGLPVLLQRVRQILPDFP